VPTNGDFRSPARKGSAKRVSGALATARQPTRCLLWLWPREACFQGASFVVCVLWTRQSGFGSLPRSLTNNEENQQAMTRRRTSIAGGALLAVIGAGVVTGADVHAPSANHSRASRELSSAVPAGFLASRGAWPGVTC
jgi:hypothetical protein